jgi:hypothetical protein
MPLSFYLSYVYVCNHPTIFIDVCRVLQWVLLILEDSAWFESSSINEVIYVHRVRFLIHIHRRKASSQQDIDNWSQSYDRELQRQRCEKFTTPRVVCSFQETKKSSTLKIRSCLQQRRRCSYKLGSRRIRNLQPKTFCLFENILCILICGRRSYFAIRHCRTNKGCQIFHCSWYQNRKKCTKWTQNVPYGH